MGATYSTHTNTAIADNIFNAILRVFKGNRRINVFKNEFRTIDPDFVEHEAKQSEEVLKRHEPVFFNESFYSRTKKDIKDNYDSMNTKKKSNRSTVENNKKFTYENPKIDVMNPEVWAELFGKFSK